MSSAQIDQTALRTVPQLEPHHLPPARHALLTSKLSYIIMDLRLNHPRLEFDNEDEVALEYWLDWLDWLFGIAEVDEAAVERLFDEDLEPMFDDLDWAVNIALMETRPAGMQEVLMAVLLGGWAVSAAVMDC